MPFELVISKPSGDFRVKLNSDIGFGEMGEILKVAETILSLSPTKEEKTFDNFRSENNGFHSGQTKLGERPVGSIKLGSYVEPTDGVRIKMVSFPGVDARLEAVRIFRKFTDLPILSAKEIVYGNFQCPVLTHEAARAILEAFKDIGVFAKAIKC